MARTLDFHSGNRGSIPLGAADLMKKNITILAIESSCDETGVSVVRKEGNGIQVLSELVTSQASIHEATGGVIPEVAAREHLNVIGPMITSAMSKAGLPKEGIDAIAVTVGPGLMPALAVGVQAARTLAFAWDKPIVPVHHIEGHIYSALLAFDAPTPSSSPSGRGREPFPALALIVSGGHTMLIEIPSHLTYTILGETLDDAVGEVFDKVARMLGLPYPGGPHVSRIAAEGNAEAFHFPRPMLDSKDLNFSYSGLKTAVLYKVQELGEVITESQKSDIAASFEAAAVDSLAKKLVQAATKKQYSAILVAGGVAANQVLQRRIQQEADKLQIPFLLAPASLCGDNATMIGQAGLFAYQAGRIKNWKDVDAMARCSIETFSL